MQTTGEGRRSSDVSRMLSTLDFFSRAMASFVPPFPTHARVLFCMARNTDPCSFTPPLCFSFDVSGFQTYTYMYVFPHPLSPTRCPTSNPFSGRRSTFLVRPCPLFPPSSRSFPLLFHRPMPSAAEDAPPHPPPTRCTPPNGVHLPRTGCICIADGASVASDDDGRAHLSTCA